MLKLTSSIGAFLVRKFDEFGKSWWALGLADQLRQRLGVRLSGTRIAIYAAATALTLILLPIGLVLSALIQKPTPGSMDGRLELLARLPSGLLAHLNCSRDAQLNCLREPSQFKDMVVTSLVGEPNDYLSARRYTRHETTLARWTFTTAESGRTCARFKSELIFDAPAQTPSDDQAISAASQELPPPGSGSAINFLPDGDWETQRGELLQHLAAFREKADADRRLISQSVDPVKPETLKILTPDRHESFWREMVGLAPNRLSQKEIASAARFQIDMQKKEADAIAAVDASLANARLPDGRIAAALRSASLQTTPGNTSEQYEKFILALLAAPSEKVHVQNVAMGLVLASYETTVRSTIDRNLSEIREHLLALARKLETSFGQTAPLAVTNAAFEVGLLQSSAARKLMSDLGAFSIPRIELCSGAFTGLPLKVDKIAGLPIGVAALAGAALWYPVNAALAVWQEALSILRIDMMTGGALILLAGLSLWLAISVQLEGAQTMLQRFGGVAVAVFLFPWYLGIVVMFVGLAHSYVTAAVGWVLGLLAIPVVSLFAFLFPKVVTAVTLVPTTVRTLVAKSKAT